MFSISGSAVPCDGCWEPKTPPGTGRHCVEARSLGCKCGPAHLLVGLSEGDGPVAAALSPDKMSLGSVITAADGEPGGAATHVNVQAQQGARQLAKSRGEALGPEHLAIVLVAYLVACGWGATHTICTTSGGAGYCDTHASSGAFVALAAGAFCGGAVAAAARVLHSRQSAPTK
jgi:hypothetical protein